MVAKTVKQGKGMRRGGFILVGVLWVLVFLAFLAVVLRLHLSGIADSVRVTEDKAAARIIAEAALSHTAALVWRGAESEEELPDRIADVLETVKGSVSFRAVNEALRVDLNTAAEPLILGALQAAGANPRLSEKFAKAILDRRHSAEPENGNGQQQTPEEPTIPFQNVAQAALIPTMPAAIALELAHYTTVASGLAGIRLHEAEPELLEAVPGLSNSHRRAIEAYRRGEMQLHELLALLDGLEYHTTDKALSWRIEMEVDLASGYGERYEAVILVAPEDERPFRVLEWRRLENDG